jgi:hypothetical protein
MQIVRFVVVVVVGWRRQKQASKLGTQFSKLVFATIITKEILRAKKGKECKKPQICIFLKF